MAHGRGAVWSVCFSASGDRIVSGGRDGNVKVWDAGSGSEVLSSASDRQALARSSTGALTACNESALQVSGASIQLLQQTVGSSGPAEVASMAFAEKVKSASFVPPPQGVDHAVCVVFEYAAPQVVQWVRGPAGVLVS